MLLQQFSLAARSETKHAVVRFRRSSIAFMKKCCDCDYYAILIELRIRAQICFKDCGQKKSTRLTPGGFFCDYGLVSEVL